jgi:hypothetical protein
MMDALMRTAGEHVIEADQRTGSSRSLGGKEVLERLGVDARQRNVRAHTRNKQQRQCIEDAGAQLRNLQRVRECGKHSRGG